MNGTARRGRSKSPFQGRRSSDELIGQIQDFEAKQYQAQMAFQSSQEQQQQKRHAPHGGSGDETAAIEVVLDSLPSANKKSPARGWSRGRSNDTRSVRRGSKSPARGWSRGRNKAAGGLDLPDLGTQSTASSAESPNKQQSSAPTATSNTEAARRKRFKEKYMDPNTNIEPRRCFTAFKTNPNQQHGALVSSSRRAAAAALPPSGDNRSQSSRSTDQPSFQSSTSRSIARNRPEPVLVLSPASRRSKGGSTSWGSLASTSKASKNKGSSSSPPTSNTNTPSTIPSADQEGSIPLSPVPTPAVPAVVSPIVAPGAGGAAVAAPPPPPPVVPKILQRFKQQKENRASLKDEKKEQEDGDDEATPPDELVIEPRPRIDLLRTKSLMSEISATSSFHDGMGSSPKGETPRTEVGRVLRTIEGGLEAASRTGKQIDRLLVYKTLLEVSDTLEDREEREAMQQELSLLLEHTQDDEQMAALRKRVLLGLPPPPPPRFENVKKVRITTPSREKDGSLSRETKISVRENTPSGPRSSEDDDDDESEGSFDSAISRDTFNFLSDLFTFDGFFGVTTPLPDAELRRKRHSRRKAGIKKNKDGSDDWSGFMEEHGLQPATQRRRNKPVSLLRTYSEETGFTDDSAFTSRYSRNDPSLFTADTQSQFTTDTSSYVSSPRAREEDSLALSPGSTSSKSWWRQKSQEKTDTGGHGDIANSRQAVPERTKKPMKKPLSNDIMEQPLLSPKEVSKPRGSRRRSSSRQRKSDNAEEGDNISLSSIESNLYDDKYKIVPPAKLSDLNVTEDTINVSQDTMNPATDDEDWFAAKNKPHPAEKEVSPTSRIRSLSRGRSRSRGSASGRSKSVDARRGRV